MSEARRHIEPYSATFILVGCKWDLTQEEESNGAEEHREVSQHEILSSILSRDTDSQSRDTFAQVPHDEARAFAQLHSIGFLETSARTGLNVAETFSYLTQAVYDKIQTGEYSLDDAWEGIKRGCFGRAGGGARSDRRRLLREGGGGESANGHGAMVEGEAIRQQKCC